MVPKSVKREQVRLPPPSLSFRQMNYNFLAIKEECFKDETLPKFKREIFALIEKKFGSKFTIADKHAHLAGPQLEFTKAFMETEKELITVPKEKALGMLPAFAGALGYGAGRELLFLAAKAFDSFSSMPTAALASLGIFAGSITGAILAALGTISLINKHFLKKSDMIFEVQKDISDGIWKIYLNKVFPPK